jgi:hypothetical protein
MPQVPQAGQAVYISFSAEIIPHTTESLIAALVRCVENGAPEVHLLLSTPGGNVMNGMNLYNVLRAMPVELAERAGHARPSMSLDVYSHVMPADEVPGERFLDLVGR